MPLSVPFPVITEYEIDFRNVRGDLTYNPIPLECGQLFTLELNDFSSDQDSDNVDGLEGLGGRL